jgi:hypothetical protein
MITLQIWIGFLKQIDEAMHNCKARCALISLLSLKPIGDDKHGSGLQFFRSASGGWLCAVLTAILGTYCLSAANAGGNIAGSVVDDSGRPVAGARVLISQAPSVSHSIAAPPVITGPLAASVTSDSTGNFHADGLVPAQYILCAEASAPGLLDPCHWSTSAPTVNLGAGQALSGLKIIMSKGSIIRVHVDDPQRLLKPVATAVDMDFQIHVVTTKGIHYFAPVLSSTGIGREHAITVPFNTPVNIRVLSPHLNVNDQSGKPFAAAGTSVNVPAGTTPSVVTFTITGKK